MLSAIGDGRGSKHSAHGDTGSPGTTPLGGCGPVTIVGGDGNGASTSPCQPEAPSGTGPAPPDAATWPGAPSVTVADQACAWKTFTGPEGRDMSGLVFDPTNADVLYAAKNKSWVFRLVRQGDLWVPDTGQRLGRRQADLLPRRRRPARLRGPHGRRRRCALRDDRARQRQQLGRPELGPAIRSDRGRHLAPRDRSVEPHARLS